MSHDVRLLRSFLVLADELHFGRAAAALHITQPALSQQMQRLERQLGITLLNRSRSGVALTEHGKALVGPARAAVSAARAVEETAALLRDGHRGDVSLGFSPGAHYAVQTLLNAFRRSRPEVRVRARQESSRALAEQVARGDLDLAIGFCTGAGPGYVTERLFVEQAVLAVAYDHPLAEHGSARLPGLDSETFALVDERDGPGYNRAVLEICRAAGLEPRTRGANDGPMAWETAVRTGGCVGLTTRSTARSSALGIRLLELRPRAHFQIELIRPSVDEECQRPTVRALLADARRLAASGLLSAA
jgi:DNA-binding transcriptional LysR family regulator